MKAALIHSFDGIDEIEIEEIPTRSPQKGEVTIQLKAAGVNPIDWKIAEGMKKSVLDYQLPITLGWEGSGVISALGEGVKGLSIGDRVCTFYRTNILHEGTFAEALTLSASLVTALPDSVSFIQGASFPLAATTAWQALKAFSRPLERLLILGGSGGVGGYAIQIAKILGCEVTATARTENHAYIKALGADFAVDYRHKGELEGPFPLILDCVGEEALSSAYHLLAPKGKIVSIVAPPTPTGLEKTESEGEFIIASPDTEFLEKFLKWIQEGTIQFPEIKVYPFEDVIWAMRENHSRRVRGKLVLIVE